MEKLVCKLSNMKELMPGDRVLVWSCRNKQVEPATVVCRYGALETEYYDYTDPNGKPILDYVLGPYPDLVDVIFDSNLHNVSHGHFTDMVKRLGNKK